MVDQDERRDDERAKRELELTRETIESQALQIQASNTKCRKQAALIRALYAELIPTVISKLRERPSMSERAYYSEETKRIHVMKVAILPRIRRRLIKMAQALDPTRLREALFPDTAMPVSWVGLAEDISQLVLSVEEPIPQWCPQPPGTEAWRPPSFTEDDPPAYFTVEKCHFPQLRDRVHSIETDTLDLFEQYLSSLEAQESQPIDSTNGDSLGKLLRSIDGIIWDLRHPSQVVRAKWQQLAEWIEMMELKMVKLLKAKELQQDLEIIEIDFGEHMSSEGLINAEIQQLEDFRTLWKLYSVLTHKISGPSTSKPLFLMSALNVAQLEDFFFQIRKVEHSLQEFATDVSNVYERRGVIKDFSPNHSHLYQDMKSLCYIIFCYSACDNNVCIWPTEEQLPRSCKWSRMWQNLHKTAWQNFLETHNYASKR